MHTVHRSQSDIQRYSGFSLAHLLKYDSSHMQAEGTWVLDGKWLHKSASIALSLSADVLPSPFILSQATAMPSCNA